MTNIIGLGNCGNNILNSISKFKNKSVNLISLQKDLQILLPSKSDINIEIKSGFTKQLDEILKTISKVFIICSSAGMAPNEYIPFENERVKSNSLISKLEDKKNLIVFDNKIIPLKEELEKMNKKIHQLILENI